MSVHTYTAIDMPRAFLRMPSEIVSCIVNNMLEMNHDCEQPARWFWADTEPEPYFNPLRRYKDALSLARTCKTLYNLLIKQIYRTDLRKNKSAALLRSVKRGSLEGVRRSLDTGAGIHTGDPTVGLVSRDCHGCYLSMDGKVHTVFSGTWHPLDTSDQATAIHWAAYLGHKDIVSLLLERGVDVNHRVRVEADALSGEIVGRNVEDCMICLEGVREEFAKRTLEQGANPLYFAIEGGDWDTIQLLIHAGAEFVTHTGCRVHALHQATNHGDAGLVKSLLKHESVAANPSAILDNRGATALHYLNYVREHVVENCKIIKILVEHGFDVNTTDGYDALPIEEAMSEHSGMITAEFIRHGSLIPERFRFHLLDICIHCLEIIEAFREAEHRGFLIGFHHADPPMVTTSLARKRTYCHLYKLVYQTGHVPFPMQSYDPDQWEVFWTLRPFV